MNINKILQLESTLIRGEETAKMGKYAVNTFFITLAVDILASLLFAPTLWVAIPVLISYALCSWCIFNSAFGCFNYMFEVSKVSNWISKSAMLREKAAA